MLAALRLPAVACGARSLHQMPTYIVTMQDGEQRTLPHVNKVVPMMGKVLFFHEDGTLVAGFDLKDFVSFFPEKELPPAEANSAEGVL
jgi:hypothetical protein